MKKGLRKNLLFIFLPLLIVVGQFLPARVWSADVFLFASNREIPNDEVVISLGVDTGSDKINAITGHLSYNESLLELVSISNANSLIPLWVESPIARGDGSVSFSGIIPGGFGGQGKILSLIFQAKTGERDIIKDVQIKNIEILRNDGLGTVVETKIISSHQDITKALDISSAIDSRGPEPFRPILSRDDPLFGGQSYLLFNTTDKGSGVYKYFVFEGVSWQEATSPYLLQNQNIARHIYVRAVDRAGNSLVVELDQEKKFYQTWWFWGIAVILVLIFLLCGKLYQKRY